MSSLRRILASRPMGPLKGPVSVQGSCVLLKMRQPRAAVPHNLCAMESPEGFEAVLKQHLDRLQPADAWSSAWSRSWSLPTGVSAVPWAIEPGCSKMNRRPDVRGPSRCIANAFADLAPSPPRPHAPYQTRLHLNYQRASITCFSCVSRRAKRNSMASAGHPADENEAVSNEIG